MLDPAVLPGFIAVIAIFLAPPGPDMAYMIAVGLEGGRSAALKAILGIATGMAVYAVAVAAGVGRLAAAYPAVLTGIKLLGAGYLVWLAVTTVRHARDAEQERGKPQDRRWYVRGVSVSLSNPKLMLFFIAVLPRFAGHAQNMTAQLLLLGAVNVAMETLLYGAIGMGAGAAGARLARGARTRTVLNYVAAAVYAVLACVIAAETIG